MSFSMLIGTERRKKIAHLLKGAWLVCKRAASMERHQLVGALLTLPWLALGVLGVFALSDSSVVPSSLYYGLVKTVVAVVLAWIADRSLFWWSPPQQHANEGQFLPQIRRAIIFFGVCVLMLLV